MPTATRPAKRTATKNPRPVYHYAITGRAEGGEDDVFIVVARDYPTAAKRFRREVREAYAEQGETVADVYITSCTRTKECPEIVADSFGDRDGM